MIKKLLNYLLGFVNKSDNTAFSKSLYEGSIKVITYLLNTPADILDDEDIFHAGVTFEQLEQLANTKDTQEYHKLVDNISSQDSSLTEQELYEQEFFKYINDKNDE